MIGRRVRIHVNLHREDFSVVDPKTGRVVANVADAVMADVTFRVQEGGRQRVLKTRCRSVHAYAIGTLVATNTQPELAGLRRVSYNPYRSAHFDTEDGQSITEASTATFANRACWIPEE